MFIHTRFSMYQAHYFGRENPMRIRWLTKGSSIGNFSLQITFFGYSFVFSIAFVVKNIERCSWHSSRMFLFFIFERLFCDVWMLAMSSTTTSYKWMVNILTLLTLLWMLITVTFSHADIPFQNLLHKTSIYTIINYILVCLMYLFVYSNVLLLRQYYWTNSYNVFLHTGTLLRICFIYCMYDCFRIDSFFVSIRYESIWNKSYIQ